MNRDFCKPCLINRQVMEAQDKGEYCACKFLFHDFILMDKTRTDGCTHRIIIDPEIDKKKAMRKLRKKKCGEAV